MATIKGGDKADKHVNGTPASEASGEPTTRAKDESTAAAHLAGALTIPASGDLVIDASSMASYLIDLEEGATQGMRREQPGLADVVQEISSNQKVWGVRAGITGDEVVELVTSTAQIAQIRLYRPAVAKLLEMLDETEAKLDDRRDTLIRIAAESVDAKAKSVGPDLFAKYEKTRAYRSAAGVKAAKTRKKNTQAKGPKGGTAALSALSAQSKDTAKPA
jgi:hypothetical protein